jgi:hypothetical protein
MLYGRNFVPWCAIAGTSAISSPTKNSKIVLHGCITRSKKYLEALCNIDTLYERKLTTFHHGASQFYYICLLSLDDFTPLLQLGDASVIPDATWKKLLKSKNPLALLDAEEAVRKDAPGKALEDLPPVHAPSRSKASSSSSSSSSSSKAKAKPKPKPSGAKVHDASLLEAMSFKMRLEKGQPVMFSISLDGCSHQNTRRRCYAQCPIKGHVKCFCYTFLHRFASPWHCMAYVLLWVRNGVGTADKAGHKLKDAPTEDMYESVKEELPKIIFKDIPNMFK